MSIRPSLHELMSLKELLQRYHHPVLALSRLLMQPLIGRRPCGSIGLRQPYSSPMHSLLGTFHARPPSSASTEAEKHSRPPIATARDV